MEPVQLAAILGAAVLLASMFSVELGISVALLELAFGVLLGNIFSLDANASWLSFIAGFASVVLTFLAGAEVDPDYFRERLKASLAIGIVSFAGPFVAATLIALGPLGWSNKASLIAGTALSTTSLAVVYAVLVETGLNAVGVGKLIMSACFVTDMCTVLALSLMFIKPTVWFPVFLVLSLVLILLLPRSSPWFFGRYGGPRDRAGDEAGVRGPVRVDGAGKRGQQPGRAARVRARPGDVASLPATPGGAAAPAGRRVRLPDAVLLPARRAERVTGGRVRKSGCARVARGGEDGSEAGPRFPARPPPRGRNRHLHDSADEHRTHVGHDQRAVRPQRTQFSLLVTIVVLSAIVPTAVAQRWFAPPVPAEQPHHLVPPEPSELLIGESS